MEDFKRKGTPDARVEKEIVFSQAIKAGKRIYYIDVKRNRKDELFVAITESKKVVQGGSDDSHVSFEKHKIFLYREDFDKFAAGLQGAIDYIKQQPGYEESCRNREEEGSDDLKIDIEF